MKIESLIPLKVKRPSGDIVLTPGTPVEFTEEEGLKLLTKAKGKVRLVEPSGTVIQAAVRWDGSPLSPVYWERGDTSIVGPATPLLFEQVGSDCVVVVEYQGEWFSVNANALRSKRQFETQKPVREVELIREAKL